VLIRIRQIFTILLKELLGWLPIDFRNDAAQPQIAQDQSVRSRDRCIDIAVVIPPDRARANRRLSLKRQSVA
jgi:hypothetical protein